MSKVLLRNAYRLSAAIIAAVMLVCVCAVGASAKGASVSASSEISSYTCDFEGNYYSSLSSVNCTKGSIREENGNQYLEFNVNSSGTGFRFEIYNSDSGVFNLKDGNTYAVTLTYKVVNISALSQSDGATQISLVRYDGSSNELVRIKAFPDSMYNPGDTTEWVTKTVVFKASIAQSAQYSRLAVNVSSPSCGSSSISETQNMTTILFDDIIINECNGTTNALDFQSNGGSYCETIMAQPGEAVTLPTPERKCYDFAGWYTDTGLTKAFNGTTMPASSITKLYAKWNVSASSIKIEYETNGGDSIEMSVGNAGEALTMPSCSRDGFRFAGWYNSDYTVKANMTAFPEESTTVYAKWEVIPHLCSFENTADFSVPNNGDMTKRCKLTSDDKYSGESALYYDYSLGTPNNASARATVVIVDENGNKLPLTEGKTYTVTFKYKVVNVTAGKDYTCSFGLVLSKPESAWAGRQEQNQIECIKYSSADIGKGWLTGSFTLQPQPADKNSNYIGLGIGGDSVVYIDEVLVYENDEKFSYKGNMICFEPCGGSECDTIYGNIGDEITLPDEPVREGYTFLGWFLDENYTVAFTDTVFNKGYTVLYAGWYKIPEKTESLPENEEPDTPPTVAEPEEPEGIDTLTIIIIAAAAAVVIAAVIVIIVVIKKKKKPASEENTENKTE